MHYCIFLTPFFHHARGEIGLRLRVTKIPLIEKFASKFLFHFIWILLSQNLGLRWGADYLFRFNVRFRV
ncbi:hypothetical protein CQA37_06330 [Helicobacter sp. MIT 99-10781]|nr:hypothetical protein CQA37_06330 [Helicobacter sp. MIT 99-10781]